MSNKKKIAITLIVLSTVAVTIIVLVSLFAPKKIAVAFEAIRYSVDDSKYCENIMVSFQGELSKRYAKDLTQFSGKIIINDDDFTQNAMTVILLKFHKELWPLIYGHFPTVNGIVVPESLIYGEMIVGENYESFVIELDKAVSPNNEEGFFIAAPATTREQAMALVEKLLPKE